jgi:hypothetical protein
MPLVDATCDLLDPAEFTVACAQELDRWEERLEELFDGRPYDVYDAALTATISNFPVSIQPFRDMVRCRAVSPPHIAQLTPPASWLLAQLVAALSQN